MIAGPCVLEDVGLGMEVAQELQRLASTLGLKYIFKSNFDKANRTSGSSYRGPGLTMGLARQIKGRAVRTCID